MINGAKLSEHDFIDEVAGIRAACEGILRRLDALLCEQRKLGGPQVTLSEPDATEDRLKIVGQKRLIFRELFDHLGQIVVRSRLKDMIYGDPRPAGSYKEMVEDEDHQLSYQVYELRHRLQDGESDFVISTIYGEGYRMVYRND